MITKKKSYCIYILCFIRLYKAFKTSKKSQLRVYFIIGDHEFIALEICQNHIVGVTCSHRHASITITCINRWSPSRHIDVVMVVLFVLCGNDYHSGCSILLALG